jgi:hypothetical protein
LPIPRKNVHSSKDYDGDFHRKWASFKDIEWKGKYQEDTRTV